MFGAHPMFRIGGAAGYSVPYSLRFRASNSANLSRTFGTPTDGKKFTLSWWMKRGTLTNAVSILSGFSGNSTFSMQFSAQTTSSSGDFLRVLNPFAGGTYLYTDTAIFRDPSAWYHFVFVFDSANATAGDRAILYVNGTRLSATVSVTLNSTTRWNESGATGNIGFGRSGFADVRDYYDGHMAEFNSVDGQALTPSSFGQTDATTGVWVPKKYSGTYGSNGFYLKFADATTTTTIGNDSSGNSNNWTTSGISVTAGTTFDQSTDTPTLGYPVISPINSQATVTISEANMASNYGGASNTGTALASIPFPTTGKWYYEHTCIAVGSFDYFAGVMLNRSIAGNAGNIVVPGTSANEYAYRFNGDKMIAGVTSAYGSSYTANDVIGVAFDADNLTIQFYKNNVAQGLISSMTAGQYVAFTQTYGGGSTKINFGQRPFIYTPPTGFKALNTQNITSAAVTTSGSFTGNAAADGPVVLTNGNPATLTINGNAVTFGTHADKIAGGFKLRTTSASYNASGTNNWTATAGNRFVQSRRPNNAQVNP